MKEMLYLRMTKTHLTKDVVGIAFALFMVGH